MGTLPILTSNPLALAQRSSVSSLLAPSLQFASLSTYSNHVRVPSAARSTWMEAAPESSIACSLAPLIRPDSTAELSANHRTERPRRISLNPRTPRIHTACSIRAMQCPESPHSFKSCGGLIAATAAFWPVLGS